MEKEASNLTRVHISWPLSVLTPNSLFPSDIARGQGQFPTRRGTFTKLQ